MVGSTAVLPTPKHRHGGGDKDVASPTSSEYESPKTPGGMTAQRMQCFKTKRCRFWLESRCTRGDRCTYAHTDVELRIPPDLTKTKICTRWKRGTCDKEAGECAYAHGMDDLREAITPSTATNTGRSTTEGLSFGVPPPATKLRDSPPYSSRSCQTISSTASTRYTSRRDSEASSNDGQPASSVNDGNKAQQQQPRGSQNAGGKGLPLTPPPISSSASPALYDTPTSSGQLIVHPSSGSPNKSVGPSSPIMMECSAISGAISNGAAGATATSMMMMAGNTTPICSSAPISPTAEAPPPLLPLLEPNCPSTASLSSTPSRAAVYATQFYHLPANAHHDNSNNLNLNHNSNIIPPVPRLRRVDESLRKPDRCTHDEYLLAVLTVPYYD